MLRPSPEPASSMAATDGWRWQEREEEEEEEGEEEWEAWEGKKTQRKKTGRKKGGNERRRKFRGGKEGEWGVRKRKRRKYS